MYFFTDIPGQQIRIICEEIFRLVNLYLLRFLPRPVWLVGLLYPVSFCCSCGPRWLNLCQDLCIYISSYVIKSWFSLIFSNMETNLAWSSVHLLDRVVLSHVSARAWRKMSVRHCRSFNVVMPVSSSSPFSNNGGSLIIAGDDRSFDPALQFHRCIDPLFSVDGEPMNGRPWEAKHLLIVGSGLLCGSGHVFYRVELLGCRETSPPSDRNSFSVSDT